MNPEVAPAPERPAAELPVEELRARYRALLLDAWGRVPSTDRGTPDSATASRSPGRELGDPAAPPRLFR